MKLHTGTWIIFLSLQLLPTTWISYVKRCEWFDMFINCTT